MNNYKITDFNPLHDNLIVRPIKITAKDGFVRPQQEEDKSELGEVISVGPDIVIPETFKEDFISIKAGDIVLYNKYSTTKTDLGDELVVRFEDIVAVLKK